MTDKEKRAHDLSIGFLNYLLEKDRLKLDVDKAVTEVMVEYFEEYSRVFSEMLNLLEKH